MPGRDMTEMAGLMGEAVEAMAASQAFGLALLRAEMAALAQVMPGQPGHVPSEAQRAAADAEVEAAFDNMPV